jgi:hypothetical protein
MKLEIDNKLNKNENIMCEMGTNIETIWLYIMKYLPRVRFHFLLKGLLSLPILV